MAGERSRKALKQRTLVLHGTFSIDEIEERGTSCRKAARTTKKKAGKKVARTAKRPARPKPSKKAAAAESGPVILANQPGIKNIAELKDTLTAALSSGSAITIDAGKVESIDIAALQLLVAFVNSAREQSRSFEWKEPSTAFCDMANLADLSRCLGIGDGCIAEEDDILCPVF